MLGIPKIRTALLLLAAMLLPQAVLGAQELAVEDLEGCIIGDDCTAESIAEIPLSNEYVAVAFANSLGEDRAAIEAMIAANPNVRISPSKEQADYLIGRYPDFPGTLILIQNRELFYLDEFGTRHYDGSDERIAKMYQRFATERYLRSENLPLVIGSLDDALLASELNGELRQILQARRLLAFRGKKHPDVDLVTIFKDCSVPEQVENCEPDVTEIGNRLSTAQYVALVAIDQYSLRFKAGPENPVIPFTLEAGATRVLPKLPDGLHVIIISSGQPLDIALLAHRDRDIAGIPENWKIGGLSTPARKSYRGGGGKAVASLFTAPLAGSALFYGQQYPGLAARKRPLGKVAWAMHEKTHRCGGSVIGQERDRYIVLTAAHCVAGEPFAGPILQQNALKFRRVKLGTLNLRYGGTTYAIDSVVVHRDYVAGGHANDIALLRIKPDGSTLVQNTKSVQLISPATRPASPTARVKWYGWGFMEETEGRVARMTSNNVVQRNPAQLHEGEMQILERKKCNMRAGYGKVTDFMLCAVTPPDSDAARRGEHVFTCQGDSGGPVIGVENGKTVQVGIVSWAVGCGANDNPSVSVNVARYQTWINIAKTKFVSGKSVEQ